MERFLGTLDRIGPMKQRNSSHWLGLAVFYVGNCLIRSRGLGTNVDDSST